MHMPPGKITKEELKKWLDYIMLFLPEGQYYLGKYWKSSQKDGPCGGGPASLGIVDSNGHVIADKYCRLNDYKLTDLELFKDQEIQSEELKWSYPERSRFYFDKYSYISPDNDDDGDDSDYDESYDQEIMYWGIDNVRVTLGDYVILNIEKNGEHVKTPFGSKANAHNVEYIRYAMI